MTVFVLPILLLLVLTWLVVALIVSVTATPAPQRVTRRPCDE
jgi:hypothetical protein